MKKDNRLMRCAIYIRVSTEEQANKETSSLDSQTDLLQRYIGQKRKDGHKLVAMYREEGLSGTNIKKTVLS